MNTTAEIVASRINTNLEVEAFRRQMEVVQEVDDHPDEDHKDFPEIRYLDEFQNLGDDDPSALLQHRFLCRGGVLLLAGPTGAGKSSFATQAGILWSLGDDSFGIEPAGPLRILVVQAENDDGDVAEMRDGIFHGMGISKSDQKIACRNIQVVLIQGCTCWRFGALLEHYLEEAEEKIDLVIIDPALAFLGGDSSSQEAVTEFLREVLLPLLKKYDCGAILVHHTNKPPASGTKSGLSGSNLAYLGTGSIEWANVARAVIGIRALGGYDIFELVLGKRGGRVGWRDELDRPIYSKFIAYHREPGVICWREADEDEVEAAKAAATSRSTRKAKVPSLTEFMEIFPEPDDKDLEKALLKAADIKSEFKARGWDVNAYTTLRDQAVAEELLEVENGPRKSVLCGRPEAVAAYREGK